MFCRNLVVLSQIHSGTSAPSFVRMRSDLPFLSYNVSGVTFYGHGVGYISGVHSWHFINDSLINLFTY